MPEANEKHTEASITAMLASKYSGSDWAFCSKVPNGTGMQKDRTADGLAMSLWPSKGLHLHGFEIKVNRSDWLKEIQDVSKAAAFARYCHYWWIVAPKGIVKLEEMPSDWGLIEAGKSLRNKKAATLRDPESPDHALLAGIFRACNKQDDFTKELKAAESRGYLRGMDESKSRFEKAIDPDALLNKRLAENYKKSIENFERTSGLTITQYNGYELGELVAFARSLKTSIRPDSIQKLKSQLETAVKECDLLTQQYFTMIGNEA